ncbi:MAG TPA: hypothetical protein ENH06_00595 [bacterium]|nr:hypothetical protein [bacterium]
MFYLFLFITFFLSLFPVVTYGQWINPHFHRKRNKGGQFIKKRRFYYKVDLIFLDLIVGVYFAWTSWIFFLIVDLGIVFYFLEK